LNNRNSIVCKISFLLFFERKMASVARLAIEKMLLLSNNIACKKFPERREGICDKFIASYTLTFINQ